MEAVRAYARGGPEQLVFGDAPAPRPGTGDALVQVHAAAITPTELTWSATYETRTGAARLPTIPSHEMSGVVTALGVGVTEVAVGDPVYGLTDFWRDGAAAEYVAVRAGDLAGKPRTVDHVHAAAIPLSALTAWQALFERGGLDAGQRILVHGAAGGVGTYAVQLAHWRGARVIGTASAGNTAYLRSLGCDEVIDYTATRFEDVVHDVDLVLDTVGGDTLERSWAVVRAGGALVSIAGTPSPETAAARHVRGLTFIVEPSRAQLVEIARLVDAGALRAIVEAVMPLARAREAYTRGLSGHDRGKLVLEVIPEPATPAS
jgi:NADPH:quinone reductase-like Zn-dependent oxidoreductase